VKAILFDRDSQIRLAQVPRPIPAEDEVLLRVGACGICASDLHLAQIKEASEFTYPVVAGHELAGTVVEIGGDVVDVQVGDHAVVHPAVPCRTCSSCHAGRTNLCQNPHIIGLHRTGGFTEYVAAPAENLYLSGDLPDIVAALTEPLACALHGLNRLDPQITDSALIFGVGTIGLLLLQLMRSRIAGRITVVDLHERRLEIARQMGADQIVVAGGNEGGSLGALSSEGFDCVIDATGMPAVVEAAFDHVAPAGKLLMLGSCPTVASIRISPRMVQRRGITVFGSFGFNVEFAPALQLLRDRRIQTDAILTHTYTLDAFSEAFEMARSGETAVKVAFIP